MTLLQELTTKKPYRHIIRGVSGDDIRKMAEIYDGKADFHYKDNGMNDDVMIYFGDGDYNYDYAITVSRFYGAGWGCEKNMYLFNEEDVDAMCEFQQTFSKDELIHGYVEPWTWEEEVQ